jgi:RNA-binding protein NOB1
LVFGFVIRKDFLIRNQEQKNMSWASKLLTSSTTTVSPPSVLVTSSNPTVNATTSLPLEAVVSPTLPTTTTSTTSSFSIESLLKNLPEQQKTHTNVTPFKHLVVDTNAVIAGTAASLRGLSEFFWTSPLALAEIRDERARSLFASLPYKIQTKVPSDECIDIVKAFATKTGDLRALSREDLHLLALTYQFEVESNGVGGKAPSYVRLDPPILPTELSRPGKTSSGYQQPKSEIMNEIRFESVDEIKTVNVDKTVECAQEGEGGEGEGEGEKEVNDNDEIDENDENEELVFAEGVDTIEIKRDSAPLQTDSTPSAPSSTSFPFDVAGGDDGEGEWIGPTSSSSSSSSSLSQSVSIFPSGIETSNDVATPRIPVACVTTDFAMQNVLLQMGLLLSTHSGKVVQSVKQWVLKCDACFSIFPISPTSLMDNKFCKWCGNATLNRLGVTLGIDGKPRYHYKKFRQINTRGTVYSLPAPKSGRASENGAKGQLLLRPDQLLTGAWKERLRQEEAAITARETLLMDRTVDDALGQRGAFGGGGWIGPSGTGPGIGAGAAPIEYAYGRANPNSNRFHHRGHKR